MAACFELGKTAKGQFNFALKGDDGQTLLRSEQYDAKASAQNGIASVQSNSGNDARYDTKTASDGRPYFNLKAGNHQVIGTSPMFADAAACQAAIAACKAAGSTKVVNDKT
jgi:uncharacterized protein YegP (UPF0339 family)